MFNKLINIVIAIISIGMLISCNLNPSDDSIEAFEVTFNDPNFEALIRETLGIESSKITNQDLWSIVTLEGSNLNISDLSGIEHCSGLRKAFFYNNNITNIEQLSNLALLENLDLQNNSISDIQPLVTNYGIGAGKDVIQLSNNPLSTISILMHIPELQSRGAEVYSNAMPSSPGPVTFLDTNFEQVIRGILNSTNSQILTSDLETILNISGRSRDISNFYGIKFCSNLDTLDLGDNSISDLVPLYYLWGITDLKLDNNQISEIRHLKYLTNLLNLNLSNNIIDDISTLSNHQYIEYLWLSNNSIADITPLSENTGIRFLSLSNNPINDFNPLSRLTNLELLELMNLENLDISKIKDLDSLKTLFLSNSMLVNIDSITNLINLESLFMNNCNIEKIDSLYALENLKRIDLSSNNISNIESLSALYAIDEMNVSNNNISDILPLLNNYGLSNGDYVLLYNNPLSEISINTYIPVLQSRGVNVFY